MTCSILLEKQTRPDTDFMGYIQNQGMIYHYFDSMLLSFILYARVQFHDSQA